MKESWVVVCYDILEGHGNNVKRYLLLLFFYWLFWEGSDREMVSAVIDECDIANMKFVLFLLGVHMISKGVRRAQTRNHHELF